MFKTVNQNYVDETNPGELMDNAIKNMLIELDPYTVFFNEQDVLKFKINTTGEYTGIGAMVSRKDGRVFIKEIYKGFPADKAGLKAGDEIVQIGDINLKEYKEDASQLLRGAKNTKVNLEILRQDKKQAIAIILYFLPTTISRNLLIQFASPTKSLFPGGAPGHPAPTRLIFA